MARIARVSARTVLVIAALIFAPSAQAQVLYKWIGADGKVSYGDHPPKGARELVRIETDPTPPPVAPAPKAPAADEKPAPARDINAERRKMREKLGADVDRARARLEAAKKALADAGELQPDDKQVIQQNIDTPARAAALGVSRRTNCKEGVNAQGAKMITCAAPVPNDQYNDKVAQLEEAVKRAEEELSAAQLAYRRGVD